MSKSKAKGTAAETEVVKYLNENNIRAKREPLRGQYDVGDIDIYPIPIVIEVKNHNKMSLSEWVDEAEQERKNNQSLWSVVWHKRRGKGSPADWYVTMTGDHFTRMLRYLDYPH
jgi:hypothetical protein